jgi:hypothetical protein
MARMWFSNCEVSASLDCVVTGVMGTRGNLVGIESSYDKVRFDQCVKG